MLVLPGGTAWEEHKIEEIDQLTARLYQAGQTIAAICAATTYLGEKGYLDSVKHTSNDLDYLKSVAPAYKGEQNYQSALAITDHQLITANGIAPIEFAAEIFRKLGLHSEATIEKWFQLFKNGVWSE